MGDIIVVPDDYDTIQYAIDNSSNGDIIRVHAGTYVEDVMVNKTISIIGNGTTKTIIQGIGLESVQIDANNSNMSEVHIEGGDDSCVMVRGNNVTIEDIYATGSIAGLSTDGADWLYVGNSTFTINEDYGIYVEDSNNVTIYGCEVILNEYDDGIKINTGSSNITISYTLVDENGYYGIEFDGNTDVRVDNCTIINNYDNGIQTYSSDRIVFEDNIIRWNLLFAIYPFQSTDIKIIDNLVSGNDFGIFIDNCENGEVKDNVVVNNNGVGIGLFDSGGVSPFWVHHNHVERNAHSYGGLESGIGVAGFSSADGNTIEDNVIIGNHKGIMLRYSGCYDNIFRRNHIEGNGLAIGNFDGAKGNIFYHNNFVDNTALFTDPNATDVFDNGYPSGGNYWDDYSGNDSYEGSSQDLPGSDGIGDTPFNLSDDSSDGYPLMSPWGSTPSEYVPEYWVM
ncbi:MAG: right-handed parallel beta-helix repeat-containing protein, partial [Thermoplasmata archaeon]|nr:right-handed parallel beta-helix repeat-containing protein [Thermoplasmata archaeon]